MHHSALANLQTGYSNRKWDLLCEILMLTHNTQSLGMHVKFVWIPAHVDAHVDLRDNNNKTNGLR